MFDATVGGPNSTSFGTVEEADEYFCQHPFGQSWANMTVAEKQSLLMYGTRIVNAQCWTGQAASPDQALAWPRVGMKGSNGYPVPSDVIPREIKHMTFEVALQTKSAGAGISSSVTDQGLKRVKAGSVEVEYFNPQDITIPFSLLSGEIKALGVATWFCPAAKNVAEFVVIPRGSATNWRPRTIDVP